MIRFASLALLFAWLVSAQTKIDYNTQIKNTPVYAASDGTSRPIATKLAAISRDAKADFGAVGDNVTDDTAAIQACITWSSLNRGICYLPPAIYKVTGNGLAITKSAGSLVGDAPYGFGVPQIWYYGTGTALTVGNSTSISYGPYISNISIQAGSHNPSTGLFVQNVSEAHWGGLEVGGSTLSNYFTTQVRFVGSAGITIDGLQSGNPEGAVGSTGVLFDEGGIPILSSTNSSISIQKADLFFQSVMFDVRACSGCTVLHAINLEAFDYLVKIDASLYNTPNTDFNSFEIKDSYILASEIAYFSNRKLAYLNAPASKGYFFNYLLNFEGNTVTLSAGVADPIIANSEPGLIGYSNIRLENNIFRGVQNDLVSVSSTNPFTHIINGWNHLYAADGATYPKIVTPRSTTSQYQLDDQIPADINAQWMQWNDQSGAKIMGGTNGPNLTRPAAGALVPGAIYGTNRYAPYTATDGFLRVGTGAGSATYANYCDFTSLSNVSDMNTNIACFSNGNEMLRLSPAGTRIGGPSYSPIQGFLYLNLPLTFPVMPAVPGCQDQVVSMPGARYGDRATVATIQWFPNTLLSAFVSGADSVTVRWCQFAGTPVVPPSGLGNNYSITLIR